MKNPLTNSVLRQAVTIAADAIICVDSSLNITFFNEGACQIFGYTTDEVIGKSLDLLLPERFRAAHRRHIAGFGDGATVARTMGERRTISGLRKDGTEFPAEAAIAHADTPEGQTFSVVLRDVTERRRIEAVNAQLVSDLQHSVAARDEMLGVVSHDLRNPVNAVKMLSAAIVRAAESVHIPPEVVEHARTVQHAAEQMDALIQDLLDVTRIESGTLRLSTHAMPVSSLIDYTVELFSPIAHESGVVLAANLGEALPPVEADPDRLAQVLSNLVGNAIKFTPRGGRVTLTADRDHDEVRISIADTGAGIPATDLPRVFDRFWQARRTNRSGAGLGLTIARGIVRGHGGRIWIESDEGQGTRVHFTLPAAKGPVTHLPRPGEKP